MSRPTERAGAFVHQIRVGWGDCDPARIAYTGRIPCWALEAIDAWWEARLDGDGWYQLNVDHDVGTPFVHMSIDFRSPITPRHRLMCEVSPARIGDSSVEFVVTGRQDGITCFTGRFVSACVASRAFRRISAPSRMREVFEAELAEAAAG